MAWPWTTTIKRAEMNEALSALCLAENQRRAALGISEIPFTLEYVDGTSASLTRPTSLQCAEMGFNTGVPNLLSQIALFQSSLYNNIGTALSGASWILQPGESFTPIIGTPQSMDQAYWDTLRDNYDIMTQ